jgi:general secretion pathway protein A
MFEGFFGLSENPFNLTPDPRFLFLSDVHKEALSHLQYGIEQRKGFVLITGEVGTGKTTLCRSLLATLSQKTRTALILNPSLSDVELLQAINQDFGLSSSSASRKELLDQLYDFLIDVFVQGENAVLIIDECQNLTPEVLEQVRLLSNLETEKEKLLQIIMIGQPELVKMLSSPNLRQINDRIVLRYHLWPLTRSETRRYLSHRMEVSGAFKSDIFTLGARWMIYRYSKGLPRRVNAIAERSLLIAYLKGRKKITRAMVAEAQGELRGNYGREPSRKELFVPVSIMAAAVLVMAIVWPSIFSELSEYIAPPIVATDHEVPKADDGEEIIPVSPDQYVIPDYVSALEILATVKDGLAGPETLNLHPEPGCLKYIPRPSIASVEKGYVVLVYATDDFVRVLGRNRAFVEIPMKEFRSLYKWNTIMTYAMGPDDKFYTRGDSGSDVERIQDILTEMGYPTERYGFYDITTASAVERMQEDFGLTRDGVAGQETLVLFDIIEKGME